MIALLGDSHTRSYNVSDNVAVRVFLAQGPKNNFKDLSNFALTTARYISVGRRLKKAGLDLGFVIGEPDGRWVVYGSWFVGDNEAILTSDEKLDFDAGALARIAVRLKHFLVLTKLFGCSPILIIGCGTPNPQMVRACLQCNAQLRSICETADRLFFDPQRSAVDANDEIDPRFVGFSVFNEEQRDHTHLSTEISRSFEGFVAEHVERFGPASDDWKARSKFSRYFVEVRNFNTYRPTEPGYTKIANMIRRWIRGILHRVRVARWSTLC